MARGITGGAASAVAELLGWWVLLTALWMVLVGPVEPLEWAVGGGSALLAAYTARGARRAARAGGDR